MDRHCPGPGIDYRRSPGYGADDGGAATHGAEPRFRRLLRDAGWHGRVLSAHSGCAPLHDGRPRYRGHPGFTDLHRQSDGGGKAPGSSAATADYLQGAESRQPFAARNCRVYRCLPGALPRRKATLPAGYRDPAGLWGDDDHSHRRGRHAYGHLAPELLCGVIGSGHGFRFGQQAANYSRGARRLLGVHPLGDHVQSDEPLFHQCSLRRLRSGSDFGDSSTRSADGAQRYGGRGGHDSCRSRERGDCSRLRYGRCPGTAQGARAL